MVSTKVRAISVTLKQYMQKLAWSRAELARQAQIDQHTAGSAVKGELITGHVARKIAEALSQSLGENILPGDIEELNVKG